MKAEEIQQKIDTLYYWDASVLSLLCDHFADEVTLVYEDSEGNVTYKFNGCYKTIFEHSIGYEKEVPINNLTRAQMPYFLHDVVVEEVELEGRKFYSCKITMSPMTLEVLCKEIEVNR
ncbi:hypothetical protein J2Z32_000310 [Paenibacillus turicensis]|uniref:Uncharacterized protein n=1 Tax=Paenibacillus turicensis TaxID=160487 RepID=A0ABS4FM86_9BACL|nr:hypothetical protein [Paenibacillus turicensis]MBP1903698.1 hypothetical protein [Paenibacillus turicensis]